MRGVGASRGVLWVTGKGILRGGGGDAPTFAVADGEAIPSPIFVFHFSFFPEICIFALQLSISYAKQKPTKTSTEALPEEIPK